MIAYILHTCHVVGMAWLYKRGGVWWIGWRHSGSQYLRSTGYSEKDQAEKELARHNALAAAQKADALTEEFISQLTGKKRQPVMLSEFLQWWLEDCRNSTSKSTIAKYEQVAREFLSFTETEKLGGSISKIEAEHIIKFLNQKQKVCSPSTAKNFRRILSSIFLRAQRLGKIQANPVSLAKKIKNDDETEKRPFTLDEIKDLYKRANPFWRFMIIAGFYTGQRMGDLVTLRWESVDFKERIITIKSRKTGQRVKIPIAAELHDHLASLYANGAHGYIWPTEAERFINAGPSGFSQEFYELMTAIGLVEPRDGSKKSKGVGRSGKRKCAGLGYHNLRHTFVTQLKVKGANEATARELAGHRSASINTHYTHLPPEILNNAISSLPGLAIENEKDPTTS